MNYLYTPSSAAAQAQYPAVDFEEVPRNVAEISEIQDPIITDLEIIHDKEAFDKPKGVSTINIAIFEHVALQLFMAKQMRQTVNELRGEVSEWMFVASCKIFDWLLWENANVPTNIDVTEDKREVVLSLNRGQSELKIFVMERESFCLTIEQGKASAEIFVDSLEKLKEKILSSDEIIKKKLDKLIAVEEMANDKMFLEDIQEIAAEFRNVDKELWN